MASTVSSGPHLRKGTVVARDCMSATGREFEFMNMAAAVAKLLCTMRTSQEKEGMDAHLGAFQTTCPSEPVGNECR